MASSPGATVRTSASMAGRAVLAPHSLRASGTTRRGRGRREGEVETQAVVITTSQLGRMRSLASKPTAAMHQSGRVLGGHSVKFESNGAFALPKSLDATVKTVKHTIGRSRVPSAGATARKARMRDMDRARHSRIAAEASRLEADRGFVETDEEKRLQVEEKANPALKYARQCRQEELDEIQALNVRMNGARVLKEQEEQIRRKNAMAEAEEAAEAAWYQGMVAADLVKVRDEMAAARVTAAHRKADYRAALAAQLEERSLRREVEQEEVELAGEAMKAYAVRLVADEKAAAVAARTAARKLREELDVVNGRSIAMKARWVAEEKEREADVMRWMVTRDKREAAHLAEQARKEGLKKKLQARMLAEQTKVLDTRAEEDQKRALAHQEGTLLAERAEGARRRHARERLMKEVAEERAAQIAVKAAQASKAHIVDDIARAFAAEEDQKVAQREAAERVARRQAQLHNQRVVQLQIAAKEEAKAAEKEVQYQERESIRRQEARRAHMLEAARAEKMAQLRKEGVPHHMQELARVTENKPRAGKFKKPTPTTYRNILQ